MKYVFICFYSLLLGSWLILLVSGIVSGDITVMNLVPMSIHGAVVLLGLSIVLKNGIHVSDDKFIVTIQIIGMILVLLGFGTMILLKFYPIPIELIWASLVGVIMLMSSKYIEFYRLMRRVDKRQ